MTEHITVSGRLSESDIKRLTRELRSGSVGPTALYYAGVTAPIISAGIASMTKAVFGLVGVTLYWQIMLSAIIAAMAGIVWYLIFMRWAYRHKHSRGTETQEDTEIELNANILAIRRGKVETRLDRTIVTSVDAGRKGVIVKFDGADPILVPNRWFGGDKTKKAAFVSALTSGKTV